MRAALPLCIVGLMVSTLAVGCGREAYERRLDESKRYFTYLDKLNQNLSAPWVGSGLKLRVPKQFQEMPAPKPKPKKDPKNAAKTPAKEVPEEPVVAERDPRQPTFADLTFPGLQGAFTTKLSVGGKTTEPGWLYVLTNSELLGRKGSDEKAAKFNSDVLHTIAQAVGQADPTPDKLATNAVPKGEAWVPKRTFKVVRPGFAASIFNKDYRIEVYNCKQEKNEVSLVYVLPENVSATEKLATNIDLSLETLQLTKLVSSAGGGSKPSANRGL
ncbi:MAG TPA: hypothetical protein VFG04_16065 [Planctomycetaceae bacterium]|jgi:hypothetical protein|nr:hypothetical protein [Planctomycetaceae bacterium]